MIESSLSIGPIPPHWKVAALRDVTSKIGSGATPRGGAKVYQEQGASFIRSQNVLDNEFSAAGLVRIGEDAAKSLSNVAVEVGDVLLNITGDSILRSCVVPTSVLPARVSQHVAIIRSNGSVESLFLQKYLTLPAVKEYMLGHSAGGTRKAITKGHIEGFLIPLPPLPEQRAIAEALGALDDKIESNRRIVKVCVRLAQLEIQAAPSERSVRVGDVAEVRKGLSYKGSGLSSQGPQMINLGNAADHGWLKREGFKHYVGEFKSKHLAHAGDLLIANTEQTWRYAIIGWPMLVPADIEAVLFTHHIFLIDFDECATNLRLPLWASLFTPGARARLEGMVYGTTVATLPAEAIADWSFAVPGDSVIAKSTKLIEMAWLAEMESKTLTELRDALLPELLSGRLRAGAATQFVEVS